VIDRVCVSPVVLLLALLVGAFLAGCSPAARPRSTASAASSIASAAPQSSAPTLRPGEISTAPDPRALLSPSLAKELTEDKDSECTKKELSDWLDSWSCYLVTRDGDLTAIEMAVHHPLQTQDATTYAANDFTGYTKSRDGADTWFPVPLGDQALRSPRSTSSLDQSHVYFRIRNVTVQVSAATGDKDKADVARLSASQDQRAWRVASDLARSLNRLGQ
jgi:hypothetical protein